MRAVAGIVLAALAALGGGGSAPIGPGGRVGPMTLARGTSADADLKLFDACDPVILKPGRYHRSCRVPAVRRLFVGYGDFEPTLKTLNDIWARTRWSLWLDGRAVRLHAFGTADRTLFAFPAAAARTWCCASGRCWSSERRRAATRCATGA